MRILAAPCADAASATQSETEGHDTSPGTKPAAPGIRAVRQLPATVGVVLVTNFPAASKPTHSDTSGHASA